MYLKIFQNVAAFVAFQNRPSAFRREENKVEFLEEQFHDEMLSLARKKLRFLLSFFNNLYINFFSPDYGTMNRNLTPSSLSKIRLLVGNTNASPPKNWQRVM